MISNTPLSKHKSQSKKFNFIKKKITAHMQSFSKNPLVGIVSCIIAFAVIITIAIVKVKYYPDEDGASVSTTETTVTTPEQQKITEEKAELKESKEVPKKKEKRNRKRQK